MTRIGLAIRSILLVMITSGAFADTLRLAITVDHLQPLGLSNKAVALIVTGNLQTGCKADAEHRLSLALPTDPQTMQTWFNKWRLAKENGQKINVLVDQHCDDFNAATVTQVIDL